MRARSGFTLVEILVTLVLVGLLVGIVVPAVMSQVGKGDNTRIMGDLEGIRSGAKLFRIDVKRYPATLEQLTENPCATDDTCPDWNSSDALPTGGTIPANLKQRWAGPYVEGLEAVAGDSVATSMGGFIQSDFTEVDMGGVPYLTVRVTGLTAENIASLDTEFDNGDGEAAGRVRWTTTAPIVMDFLAAPLN